MRRKFNTRMAVSDNRGGWLLRVWKSKGRGWASGRLLVKCGDCKNQIRVDFDAESIDINGVMASKDQWRTVLGPLLKSRRSG